MSPYKGIPNALTNKMEKCVLDLQSQGKTKEQAIAICHASIMGEENTIVVTAGLNLEPATEADLVDVDLTAEQKSGRILKFTDAVVARCEINKNDDGFTSDGLKELAATLPMMPLHVDHEPKKIMGVFVAARTEDWVRDDGLLIPDGSLVTDGIIFAQDWPQETNEVISGERKLSIEANAAKAVFHVDKDTGKRTRYLFGFTATGAGTTKNPAGYNTVFDTEKGLLLVASVKEEVEVGSATVVKAEWWKKYTDSVLNLNDGDFAWLSTAYKAGKESKSAGRKYPYKYKGKVIEEGWRAAWGRAHQQPASTFSGGPSKDEVLSKLKKAKPKGVNISADNSITEETVQSQRQRSAVWYMIRDAYQHEYGGNANIADIDLSSSSIIIKEGEGLFKIDYQITSEGNVAFSGDRVSVRKAYISTSAPYLPVTQASKQQSEETMSDKDEVQVLNDKITTLEASLKELKESVAKLEKENQELTTKADKVQALEAELKEANEKIEKHGEELEQKETEAQERAKVTAARAIKLLPILGDKRIEELMSELPNMDENAFNLVAEVADKSKAVAGSVSVGDVVAPDSGGEVTLQSIFGAGG